MLWDFQIETITESRPEDQIFALINKEERGSHLKKFAVLTDHRMKIKESEMI